MTNPTDPLPLAIAMLEECDRWAAEAYTFYTHKVYPFQTDLSLDQVYEHQQKIRITLAKLKGTTLEEEGVVT